MHDLEHIKDIDFRTREERQKQALPDFVEWYKDLAKKSEEEGYSDLLQGQLTMLSSVLWYLLPEKDYKKLVRR
jgi:hypothetical protein